MNYFDMAVDENALWILFHYDDEDFVSVAKMDINNLTIYETFNLTMINHTDMANGFVVCGVLYVVSLLQYTFIYHKKFFLIFYIKIGTDSSTYFTFKSLVVFSTITLQFKVQSSNNLKSEISIAYDFYRERYQQPNIHWINLYRNANMMSYNPFDKRIYIYDHGYLLTVPVRLTWRAK